MNEDQPFTPPPPASGQRKKRVRWWLILSIFAVPFLLICLAIFIFRVGYTIRENSGRQAMAVEIEKLISEGQPVDNASVDELYRSRTSDQHTDEWLELLATIESPDLNDAFAGIPLLDRTTDDAIAYRRSVADDWKYAEACTKFTTEQQELIAQIHRLAKDPTPTHFPIYFQSSETLLPEVQSMRTVARILFIDAQVAIHLKDRDRVAKDVISLYALTRQVDAVPCAVSHLVGIALRRLGLEVLQRCIEIDLLNDDQLRSMDQMLQNRSEIGDRWRTSISDEFGLYLEVFTNPAIAMKSDKPMPARGHDAVYFISLMRRAMELQTDQWTVFYDSALALEAELDSGSKSIVQATDHILTHLVTPAFGAIAAACINEAQTHRLARLAIAIRLYAHQAQSLPTNLDDMRVLTEKLHPSGSEPFGYQTTSDGAVLWGFELSKSVRQTPASPTNIVPTLPGAPAPSEDALWIWPMLFKPH